MNQKIILSIESSCDETAVSIVAVRKDESGNILAINVLAHEVESQIEIHKPFCGVVPEVAARDHLAKIHDITSTALRKAGCETSILNAIAVTFGPGLIGALMVGVLFARGLALSLKIPLIAVNHVDAHLAPAFFLQDFCPTLHLGQWLFVIPPQFPALALTVSGGHCHLSLFQSLTEKKLLGKSLDDACGEAFDKTAKLLGLPYPGGPLIETLALMAEKAGHTSEFSFPYKLANRENRHSFSYSGLKTAVVEAVRKETKITTGKITGKDLVAEKKQSIAYAFQQAALMQLSDRVTNALQDFSEVKSIYIAGGVAQNKKFREIFSLLSKTFHKEIFFAAPALCSDNATMIALHAFLSENKDGFIKQPFAKYALGQ